MRARADTATLALAAFRLTRLVTTDRITAPLRDRVYLASTRNPAWEPVEEMVGCDWCVGVWASAAVLVLERSRPGRFVNRVLAVSALVGLAAERT